MPTPNQKAKPAAKPEPSNGQAGDFAELLRREQATSQARAQKAKEEEPCRKAKRAALRDAKQKQEQPEEPSQEKDPDRFTAAELIVENLTKPECVVQALVTPGLNVLAGRPKMGKSFIALDMCLAVATETPALGTQTAQAGDVLYLALEDPKWRLQERLRLLLGDRPAPANLTIWRQSRLWTEGGKEEVEAWLEKAKDPRLIAIDTLARIRAIVRFSGNPYAEDYQFASDVKALADSRDGLALLLNHHTRKAGAEDIFDTVSGTTGITGAADTVLVLKRSRGKAEAELHVTGRDIGDCALGLSFSNGWTVQGNAEELRLSEQRQQILDVLKEAKDPMQPKEIAEQTGMKVNNVRYLLFRMRHDGQVQNTDTGYVITPKTTNTANGPTE
jgi:RecA-family ATPase